MRDAVICEPLRTPVGGFGGSLRDVPRHELAATVVRAVLERTGIDARAVDDVMLGHCYPTMRRPAIGRVVALDAGLPVTGPGLQIDRRCGSGLQAVIYAAMQVRSGRVGRRARGRGREDEQRRVLLDRHALGRARRARVLLHDALARGRVTAGGAQLPGARRACSRRPRTCAASTASRARSRTSSPCAAITGRAAGAARRAGSPRRSCRCRCAKPATTSSTPTSTSAPTSTVETLAALRADLGRGDPEATVTAGNASGQNDGAAVCVVTHPRAGRRAGPAAAGPAGVLGRRRGAARADGHRPGAGHREGARARPASRWPTWTSSS